MAKVLLFVKPRISSDAKSVLFQAIEGGISKIYVIEINHAYDPSSQENNWLISYSRKVGLAPMVGPHQQEATINTCYWDQNEDKFISLDNKYEEEDN
jgi:hypothetical protein